MSWPHLEASAFTPSLVLPQVAGTLLAPFVAGDPLAQQLPQIASEALNFEAPLVALDAQARLQVLELFHGPTAAFKDFGARFLASCFGRLHAPARTLTILVATSGDTGGAVAAAFHGRPGVEVVVLFPKGLVSPTQERQLTCWGGNVRSLRVRGTFDDCQRLVKAAFADPALSAQRDLSSANSINLGRLLPQSGVLRGGGSLAVWRKHGERASCTSYRAVIWATRSPVCGPDRWVCPLARSCLPTTPTARCRISWRAVRGSRAPAYPRSPPPWDVGNPSNMERLRALFPGMEALRGAVSAIAVTDAEIRERICAGYREYGQIWCPHTAAAAEAWTALPAARREVGRWVLVSTAHPAKFREIVEPLIGRTVPVPDSLAQLFARPAHCTDIDATLAALQEQLTGEE